MHLGLSLVALITAGDSRKHRDRAWAYMDVSEGPDRQRIYGCKICGFSVPGQRVIVIILNCGTQLLMRDTQPQDVVLIHTAAYFYVSSIPGSCTQVSFS